LDNYQENDGVQGRVTKVVTFGAFVEILPGVEGLVHISELAQHHVENPREVVSQGDPVNVLILEVDAERRRLSLSLKRVEEGMPVQPRPDGAPLPPAIDLSADVFAETPAAATEEQPAEEPAEEPLSDDEPSPDSDAADLAWLVRLLHSRVAVADQNLIADLRSGSGPPRLAVVEIPLLYETGGERRFDRVVVVTAPQDLRAARSAVRSDDRWRRLIP